MYAQPEMVHQMYMQIKNNCKHLEGILKMFKEHRSNYDLRVQINAMFSNALLVHTMFIESLYIASQSKIVVLLTTPQWDDETLDKILKIKELGAGYDDKELVNSNDFLDSLKNNMP